MLDREGLDSLVGRTFKGYRVTRFIARGGMGVVFEAVQESLDRPVAIKFLYPHLSDDERFRDRFEREARAAARLSHPNIVRILDFGSDGPLHFMVLDLIDGESLRDRLARIHGEGSTLQTEAIIRIVQQIGGALSYAHQHGYVHRDVKPGNILLTPERQAYLADFGVVKIVGASGLTGSGVIIGTPEYMAPEQSSGAPTIGPAADLYSLAIVTYEMMVGRVPFQAPTPVAVMRMQLSEPPPPPSSIVPWFPPPVESTLMRALEKNPEDRFESVDEFVESLTAAAGQSRAPTSGVVSLGGSTPISQPVQAPVAQTPSTPVEPVAATAAPNGVTRIGVNRLAIFSSLAAILAVAFLGAFWAFARDDPGDDDAQLGLNGDLPTATATQSAGAASATGTGGSVTPEPSPTGTTVVPVGVAATPTPEASPTPTPMPALATPTPESAEFAILFSSHRGGIHDSQIYIMGADGSGQRQLTFARGHSWGPRASPDGRFFFFSSVAPGEHESHEATGGGTTGQGNHDIYVAEFAGANTGDLSAVTITNVTAGQTSWDNAWSWSPDSRWITFTSDRGGNWEIYRMDPTGGNITQLTTDPAEDGWPVWTPDGQQIIFSSNRSGDWEIYIMDQDGTNVRQLTNMPSTDELYPEISPDGTRIVFSSQVAAVREGEIYIMDSDGSNSERLTSTAALNNIPSWCPDGESIVFVSDRDGNDNIYRMNADGSDMVRLTDDPGEDTTPFCMDIGRAQP